MTATKPQARPAPPIPLSSEAFAPNKETDVYWLASSTILINSFGTTLLMDPTIMYLNDDDKESMVGEVIDDDQIYYMKFLYDPPMLADEMPLLDGVLLTHADVDHMGPRSIQALAAKGNTFHGTEYVANDLRKAGVPEAQIVTHAIGDRFKIKNVEIELTETDHPWQKFFPEVYDYVYQIGDCCGFKLYCPDCTIWNPGDSLLMDSHFDHEDADLILMDFSEDPTACHVGQENAVKLANHYSDQDIIMIHWGFYDAPTVGWCSADPEDVKPLIENPQRFHILAPGEKFRVKKIIR
ncbi:MAG: MBL fold metallo-hydrolase [Firmicutes bacterium]|nr:MBL fold metallo-hydrolase [Bacillota bacterium]